MPAPKKRYIAYTDMGNGVGAPVDPADHGGEDHPDFKYLLERRNIVPLGDPDAAIAMGTDFAQEQSAEAEAAREDELNRLRARVAELEAADAAKSSSQQESSSTVKTGTSSGSGSTATSSSQKSSG